MTDTQNTDGYLSSDEIKLLEAMRVDFIRDAFDEEGMVLNQDVGLRSVDIWNALGFQVDWNKLENLTLIEYAYEKKQCRISLRGHTFLQELDRNV